MVQERKAAAEMEQTVVRERSRTPHRKHPIALEIPMQRKAEPAKEKHTVPPVSLRYGADTPGFQNRTGIPDSMLLRAETLSGLSLRDVRTHYNSGIPAGLGALAVAQNPHIYLGPSQEGHLGHELGHIIQQKRGVVRPQFRMGGRQINASPYLERDAESWGGRLGAVSVPVQLMAAPDRFMAGAALAAGQSFETAQCFFPELWAGLKKRVTWERIKKSSLWSLIDATQVCIANLCGGSVGTTAASSVGIAAQIMNALGLWARRAETNEEARETCGCIMKTLASVLGVLTAAGSDISSIVAAWTSREAEKRANFASRGFAVGSDAIGILTAVAYASDDEVNLRAWFDILAMLYNACTNSAALGIMGDEGNVRPADWALIGELIIRLLRLILTWIGVGKFRPPDLDEGRSEGEMPPAPGTGDPGETGAQEV